MSGRSARRKGANAERELFALLNERIEGNRFKRNLLQSRVGGADNEGRMEVTIEVKRQEKLSLLRWLAQVREAAHEGSVPVLAWRRNGEPWQFLVDMNLEQFTDYLEKVHGYDRRDTETAGAAAADGERGAGGTGTDVPQYPARGRGRS